jgi:hypothetical protein
VLAIELQLPDTELWLRAELANKIFGRDYWVLVHQEVSLLKFQNGILPRILTDQKKCVAQIDANNMRLPLQKKQSNSLVPCHTTQPASAQFLAQASAGFALSKNK